MSGGEGEGNGIGNKKAMAFFFFFFPILLLDWWIYVAIRYLQYKSPNNEQLARFVFVSFSRW